MRVLGPLGKGFPLEEAERAEEVLVVGGGLGMPPLLYLCRRLSELGVCRDKLKIFLGFTQRSTVVRNLRRYGTVFMASDDGATGFKGNAVQCLQLHVQQKSQNQSAAPRFIYLRPPTHDGSDSNCVYGQIRICLSGFLWKKEWGVVLEPAPAAPRSSGCPTAALSEKASAN